MKTIGIKNTDYDSIIVCDESITRMGNISANVANALFTNVPSTNSDDKKQRSKMDS